MQIAYRVKLDINVKSKTEWVAYSRCTEQKYRRQWEWGLSTV